MRVLYVDSETGGFKKPITPVEVGGILLDNSTLVHDPRAKPVSFVRRYKPERPMEWGAIATHHILPQELDGEPRWNPNVFKDEYLQKIDYLVGWNVDYDWEAIGKPDIRRIDGLAIARYWLPDVDAHKLSAMVYYMFGASEATREMLKNAHSALADIGNTKRVVEEMVKEWGVTAKETVKNWNELYLISEIGRVPFRMTFGKYGPKDGNPGKRIRDLTVEDPGYVAWLKKNCAEDIYLMKALKSPR